MRRSAQALRKSRAGACLAGVKFAARLLVAGIVIAGEVSNFEEGKWEYDRKGLKNGTKCRGPKAHLRSSR